MQSNSDLQALASLLDWYRAMGVDAAVGETSINWLERPGAKPGQDFKFPDIGMAVDGAESAAARTTVSASPRSGFVAPPREALRDSAAPSAREPAPRREFPTKAPDVAESAARSAARNARTLVELGNALAAFDGCALKATAKNLCFYRGAPAARVMIIGEAPGRDEDIEGKPFVGRAGQLLDKMLAAIKLGEDGVHITNIVYWRPPGNRTPTPQEAQVCRPFLERQIELVAPDILILLGGAAAKEMLGVAEGIMRIRGKWRDMEFAGRKIKTIATLHPAYLLRTPAAKRLAWRDLLAIDAVLNS